MSGYYVTAGVVVVVFAFVMLWRYMYMADNKRRAKDHRQVDIHKQQLDQATKAREDAEKKRLKEEEEKRADEIQRREVLLTRFKELFGRTFVATFGWHRNVLESQVDSLLHATAYALHDAFVHEQECENSGVKGSAMLGAKTASTQLKKRFWDLFNVARDLELPVRWYIMPNRDQPNDHFVVTLPRSVKDQMVLACPELRAQRSKIIGTYRVYVSPVEAGFFTGDVSFCDVRIVSPVHGRLEESVETTTVEVK